jgi:hypothetical protein
MLYLIKNQLPKQKFKGFSFIVPSLLIAYSGLQRHRYLQICNLGIKVIRPQQRFFLLNAERSDKNCQNDTVLFMRRTVRFPHQLTDLEQKQLTSKMIARTGAQEGDRLSPLCSNDILKKRISINQLTDLEQKQLTSKMIARTGAQEGDRLSPLCSNDILKKRISINQLTDLEQKQLTSKMIARTGAHAVRHHFFGFIQIFKNLVGGLEVENLHCSFVFSDRMKIIALRCTLFLFAFGGVMLRKIKKFSFFNMVGLGTTFTPPSPERGVVNA